MKDNIYNRNKNYRKYSQSKILEKILLNKVITEIGKPILEGKQLRDALTHSRSIQEFARALNCASDLCKKIQTYDEIKDKKSSEANIFKG